MQKQTRWADSRFKRSVWKEVFGRSALEWMRLEGGNEERANKKLNFVQRRWSPA